MYIKCTWIITHTHTHTYTRMLTYTVYPTHVRVLTCAHSHLSTVQSSKKDKKGVKEVKKPADTKQKGKEKEKVRSRCPHHATCMKQMLCTHIYTHIQTYMSTCMHRYTHSYTDVLSTKVGPASSGKAINLWLPKNLKVWPSILAEVVMILCVSYHFAANIKDNDKPEVQSKCTCTLSTSSTPM